MWSLMARESPVRWWSQGWLGPLHLLSRGWGGWVGEEGSEGRLSGAQSFELVCGAIQHQPALEAEVDPRSCSLWRRAASSSGA